MTRAERLMLTFSFGNVARIVVIYLVFKPYIEAAHALVGAFT